MPTHAARHALPVAVVLLAAAWPPTAAAGRPSSGKAAAPSTPRASVTTAKSPGSAAPAATPITADQLRALSWRSVGPANMGGRVADLAFVPGKPAQFFAGVATGGVFKTTNDGITWSAVFDDQSTLTIGSVAVAPSDPKVVWVGTGEGNGRNSSTWGNGAYRSTDGGDSFTRAGLEDSREIPRLAVHPTSADTAYAACMGNLWAPSRTRGLYKTTDGGKTWKAVLAGDDETGCIDVALDPAHPDTVYAALYARRRAAWSFRSGSASGKAGLYKSIDGGASWRKLEAGLPHATGRVGLALSRQDSSHVFAVIESDEAGSVPLYNEHSRAGGVFASTDGGDHWTRLSDLTPRSFYFSKIVVDPKDEKRVYLLGFGLGISDDGGHTFRPNGALSPHGDLHALVVDAGDSDHLLLGTDGGIYESWDRAKTWRFHDNLAIGEYYEVGLGMDDPYTICGGLQDNGTWCGPSRGLWRFGPSDDHISNLSNTDWWFAWGGDGYFARIDPRDAGVIYGESQQGGIGRIERASGAVHNLKPEAKEGTSAYRFNWDSPFEISHHDPDVLYLGGSHIFKLTKRGDEWQEISPDLGVPDVSRVTTAGSGAETYGTVVALSESPVQRGVLWAGTDDGHVWLTRDEGAHWTDVSARLPAPKGTYVSEIDASHAAVGAALVSLDGHRSGDDHPYVAETRDFGATWRSVASGLPAGEPVRVVREDPVNENLVFAGTENDVQVSLDRGAHWVSLRGKSLPPVAVHDIQIQPRDRDVVIGTHGRSIYVLDDISGLEQLTPELRAKAAALLTPRPAKGFYYLDRGGEWSDASWSAKDGPAGAILEYWVSARNLDGAKLTVKDASGQVMAEINGAAEAGLNRVTWDLTRKKEERYDTQDVDAGHPAYVPAGTYDVELSMGKEKGAAKLVVSYPAGVGPQPVPQR